MAKIGRRAPCCDTATIESETLTLGAIVTALENGLAPRPASAPVNASLGTAENDSTCVRDLADRAGLWSAIRCRRVSLTAIEGLQRQRRDAPATGVRFVRDALHHRHSHHRRCQCVLEEG